MLSKNAWRLTVGSLLTIWVVYLTVQLLAVQKKFYKYLSKTEKKVTFKFAWLQLANVTSRQRTLPFPHNMDRGPLCKDINMPGEQPFKEQMRSVSISQTLEINDLH